MHAVLRLFINFIHSPEWVAAVALLIQAVILLLQAIILHQHSETMKKHAGIAKGQAITAESIGKVLTQHATLIDKQTTILDQQFKFQRRIEAQAEWVKLYEVLKDIDTTIALLIEVGSRDPRDIAAEHRVFVQLIEKLPNCEKLLVTSIHLAPSDKRYFVNYVADIIVIVNTPSKYVNIVAFATQQTKYSNLREMMIRVNQPTDGDQPAIVE